jgi:ribosome-associated toxin RatA of RatAB toxin-antitoxin module
MMFKLHERPPSWLPTAPIRIEREMVLEATAGQAFEVLADIGTWPRWFTGMAEVVVESPASGVGATRIVKAGATRIRERFLVWEPDRRLVLALAHSNVPGMRALVEEWLLEPIDETHTRLRLSAGVEVVAVLRPFSKLVRNVVTRQITGADGLVAFLAANP